MLCMFYEKKYLKCTVLKGKEWLHFVKILFMRKWYNNFRISSKLSGFFQVGFV